MYASQLCLPESTFVELVADIFGLHVTATCNVMLYELASSKFSTIILSSALTDSVYSCGIPLTILRCIIYMLRKVS